MRKHHRLKAENIKITLAEFSAAERRANIAAILKANLRAHESFIKTCDDAAKALKDAQANS